MTELNFGCEHLRAGSDSPRNDGFLDDTLLYSLDDLVLLDTTDLSEEDEHLDVVISLVAEEMVDEGGSGVPVSSNGNTLVGTVGG